MRTCVIFNPVAKGNKARHFRAQLGELGRAAELRATAGPGDATRLASQAIAEGYETIVAAGGDGTLNEVVDGFARAGGRGAICRLGLIPLGTVNVFARELGIPFEAGAAWRVATGRRERLLDMPLAEFAADGNACVRAFAQMAGAGLDALAIERVSWKWKKRVGPLAYVMSGLSAMCATQSQIRVQAGGDSAVGELVLVGNGRLYGGSFKLFPDAAMDDGLLDATVIPRATWATLLRCGVSLLAKQRLPATAVRTLRGPELKLTTEQRTPFELDGELVGTLPVTFRMGICKLRVAVP